MTKPPRKKSQPLLRETDAPIRSRPRKPRDPAQPQLPFDPMPDRIEPCLALLKAKPPSGPDWIYEIKWDGYRIAVHIEPNSVRIITRGGHDWTDRFPAIAAAARKLGVGTAILDGEAVVLDAEGRSDFGALQRSLGGRGGRQASGDAILYAFDLLYFDGYDLTKMELSGRRHLLDDLIGESEGVIRLSQEVEADGAELLAAACKYGLEGIIAKHRDRPYRPGRLGDWLKIKCIQSESFVIVGYEPSAAALGGIGRLLLAAYRDAALVYVGSVGTGFKEREANELRRMLETLKTKRPPVTVEKQGVVFTQPTLIADIQYRAWTDDGKLRHAAYKGLREVHDNADIYKLS
ncbi:bifunctional non-homologous end joining protein LigD [Rhizobium sp. PP-F2F-G48]|uniref:non-homologous end-joining DNA ligase n=1 Tax=Rhizobium sp. PP-F2F-G48 TaxID=2135651 RepID=UPI00104E4E0C|nr:non-homologous end-joining DNA ligase [Rhizobium sp. PP-F2F-G48]TCM48348.1 bifunctional non-homologous end joining protein LigD [Rhizobium sp. PP-F2F-G48]